MVLILILTMSSFSYAEEEPLDTLNQNYHEAIEALTDIGVITGDVDGQFHSDQTLTRAQACTIIVKSMNPAVADIAATATQTAPHSGFADMDGYSWAEGYVSYAVKCGITNGYPDGSFQPANRVTTNEFVTMIMRAAGWNNQDVEGTWPENYLSKARELNLLSNLPKSMPDLSTKGMAAQITYDALSLIEKANETDGAVAQGLSEDALTTSPEIENMFYLYSRFSSSMSSYGGKEIAKDAKIYTFGVEKDYSDDMTFSAKGSDYREQNFYRYKNVKTPSFIKVIDNKIVEMIVPTDVGFTGKVYCVINNTFTTIDTNGDRVTGLETLTAERPITWLCKKNIKGIPSITQYQSGAVYELALENGQVQAIAKTTDDAKQGAIFEELSGTTGDFVKVLRQKDYEWTLAGGKEIMVKANATVYRIHADKTKKYEAEVLDAIQIGDYIRAYDMSDDGNGSADMIVVQR